MGGVFEKVKLVCGVVCVWGVFCVRKKLLMIGNLVMVLVKWVLLFGRWCSVLMSCVLFFLCSVLVMCGGDV